MTMYYMHTYLHTYLHTSTHTLHTDIHTFYMVGTSPDTALNSHTLRTTIILQTITYKYELLHSLANHKYFNVRSVCMCVCVYHVCQSFVCHRVHCVCPVDFCHRISSSRLRGCGLVAAAAGRVACGGQEAIGRSGRSPSRLQTGDHPAGRLSRCSERRAGYGGQCLSRSGDLSQLVSRQVTCRGHLIFR